ncbi:hypothetical protein LSTR_LSTR010738 [Laodelphax striatellus]|uniref:Uncharacterized protein n=1 Tax=Laodelphax striatellus TaxID=195883 RepID=A0A482XT35_LAOST|nr:hypothetical protein LSTR_LSTR010738 [Laodelphax striatellus]
MVSLSYNNQTIALTFDDKMIFAYLQSKNIIVVVEKNTAPSSGPDNRDNDEDDSKKTVTYSTSDVSKCGAFFVFACGKYLSLWKLMKLKLISNRCLQKRANKVRFSPNCDSIVVADKSGDVFLFSVKNPLDPGILILGHLSMLLDVIVSPDEQFIITCDRDEKIRVSLYPNAYNIQTYCLGHEEFVTSLQLLPHSQDILISTSGDGSVKLWDFKKGNLIQTIYCSPTSNATNHEDRQSNDPTNAIVTSSSAQLKNDESLVCFTVNERKCVVIFKIKGWSDNITHEEYTLTLESEPIDILMGDENILWVVLFEEHLRVEAFTWDNTSFKSIENVVLSEIVSSINKDLINVKKVTSKKDMIPLLFKRSFDNVKDYLKRKNDRLCDQNEKKIKIDTSDS